MVQQNQFVKTNRAKLSRQCETNHVLGVHFLNSDTKLAEQKLMLSLEQRIYLYGPNHLKVAETHQMLGETYMRLGQSDKSKQHYSAARIIRTSLRGGKVLSDRRHNVVESSDPRDDSASSSPSERINKENEGQDSTKAIHVNNEEDSLNEREKLLLGRYKIAHYPDNPMSHSSSSKVYSGVDMNFHLRQEYRNVAIKIVSSKEDFECQLRHYLGLKLEDEIGKLDGKDLFLSKLKTQLSKSMVLPIIRYHREQNILVLPLADRNLDEIIRNEDLTTTNYLQIRDYLKTVAMSIRYLHSQHNIIHGDIKPRNFVLYNGTLKLIDFHDAAPFDSVLQCSKNRSSGYMAPELAKKLFQFDESKDIQYWIGQEKEILKKLLSFDRTKTSDQENIHFWGEKLEEAKDNIKRLKFISTASKNKETLAHPSVDTWSFGVLAYFMFTGSHLFRCNQNDDLFPKDTREQHKLVCWNGLTSADSRKLFSSNDVLIRLKAIDLLKQCLHPNPNLRVCCMSQILNHPFFNDTRSIEKPIQRKSFQSEIEISTLDETARSIDEESVWKENPRLTFKRKSSSCNLSLSKLFCMYQLREHKMLKD